MLNGLKFHKGSCREYFVRNSIRLLSLLLTVSVIIILTINELQNQASMKGLSKFLFSLQEYSYTKTES